MSKTRKYWWWKCRKCGGSFPVTHNREPRAGCRVCGNRGAKTYEGRGTVWKLTEPYRTVLQELRKIVLDGENYLPCAKCTEGV